jgi:transcription initiation factor IIF auxiliary subunit
MKTRIASYMLVGVLGWLWLLYLPPLSAAQEISAGNTSRYLGDDRWSWTVFLKASPQVLNNIECVEYILHPTFPDPVQRVCKLGDQNYPFALSASGWGTFRIRIRVFMQNGRDKDLTHNLTFRK